ncbi:hypothetical protein Aph02nite_49630 [Actinoplanes philippinensis]|uniref:SipW-cognate class signal peptide n=1 Tax=Actinoplanes philippinensis TaxID=35752 RepID=A0A1I2IVZ2_9ACTN|nr:hypothetical protein [Actinoplanes philippinensis]GIE79013.1 hypothetical protein Aph02nite_49630 [Actinoplanes philippinensis]SFF44896.1 hypothetical protein SAMN05421541_110398 [Actinoplanes philippinensis]
MLKPLSMVLSVALLVTGAVIAYPADDALAVDVTLAAQGAPGGLGVSGSAVTGLYPGNKGQLTVVVKNPYRFPVSITAVSGHLVATSRPGCKATYANLTIGRYAGAPALPARIAAGKQARLGYLPVWMPAKSVADACQGATFTLRLNATARKAG